MEREHLFAWWSAWRPRYFPVIGRGDYAAQWEAVAPRVTVRDRIGEGPDDMATTLADSRLNKRIAKWRAAGLEIKPGSLHKQWVSMAAQFTAAGYPLDEMWQPWVTEKIARGEEVPPGGFTPKRLGWDEGAAVVLQHIAEMVIHPGEIRGVSHREASMLMGFPETWKINAPYDRFQGALIANGVTVEAGRFVLSGLDQQNSIGRTTRTGQREMWHYAPEHYGRPVPKMIRDLAQPSRVTMNGGEQLMLAV